jgi:DNA-binding NarL/FixJ family response regulator
MSLDLADINGITVLRNIKKNFNAVRVLIFTEQPEHVLLLVGFKLVPLDICPKLLQRAPSKELFLKFLKVEFM